MQVIGASVAKGETPEFVPFDLGIYWFVVTAARTWLLAGVLDPVTARLRVMVSDVMVIPDEVALR